MMVIYVSLVMLAGSTINYSRLVIRWPLMQLCLQKVPTNRISDGLFEPNLGSHVDFTRNIPLFTELQEEKYLNVSPTSCHTGMKQKQFICTD